MVDGMDNLRAEAQKRGLEENRLIFAEKIPHDEYLAHYAPKYVNGYSSS